MVAYDREEPGGGNDICGMSAVAEDKNRGRGRGRGAPVRGERGRGGGGGGFWTGLAGLYPANQSRASSMDGSRLHV